MSASLGPNALPVKELNDIDWDGITAHQVFTFGLALAVYNDAIVGYDSRRTEASVQQRSALVATLAALVFGATLGCLVALCAMVATLVAFVAHSWWQLHRAQNTLNTATTELNQVISGLPKG